MGEIMITFGAIFMLCAISLAHILTTYKITFIHESGLCILLGLFGGSCWMALGPNGETTYEFSSDVFFDVILPPIIFAAAYNLKNKQFINNFNPIMVLAIIGALINFLIMSIVGITANKHGVVKDSQGNNFDVEDSEIMLFASLMSATDGIAVVSLIDSNAYPSIFGTLIGEGCINDAVAIILYASVDSLSKGDTRFGFTAGDLGLMFLKVCEIAFLSILIGCSCGLCSALYFKHVRHTPSPSTELTIVFLFGYLSYNLCDATGMSGIIGVFFCGVLMSHYTYHNLTPASQHSSREAFEAIAYGGETFIYISLGFYIFSYTNGGDWSFGFIFTMLAALIGGRVIIVGTCLGIIYGCCGTKTPFKNMAVYWWGGIVRGSICFALSLKKKTPHSNVIVTTTFFCVIVTTLVIGSLTDMYLVCLGVKNDEVKVEASTGGSTVLDDTRSGMSVSVRNYYSAMPMPAHKAIGRKRKRALGKIRKAMYRFDEEYMKKWFGGKQRIHDMDADNPEFVSAFKEHVSREKAKSKTARKSAAASRVKKRAVKKKKAQKAEFRKTVSHTTVTVAGAGATADVADDSSLGSPLHSEQTDGGHYI